MLLHFLQRARIEEGIFCFSFFFFFFSSPFLIYIFVSRTFFFFFFSFFFFLIILVENFSLFVREREREWLANHKYDYFSCAQTAVEMLARLRSGYSLDSEYLRVQDRFRLEDGVFVLLGDEKQQQQQGSSQRRTSTTTTTSRTVPDAPTQEAIQREYLELIKWSNMPIDPQLLGEKGQQQQQQQQRKDQQERQQEERHEQPEQQQQPE